MSLSCFATGITREMTNYQKEMRLTNPERLSRNKGINHFMIERVRLKATWWIASRSDSWLHFSQLVVRIDPKGHQNALHLRRRVPALQLASNEFSIRINRKDLSNEMA